MVPNEFCQSKGFAQCPQLSLGDQETSGFKLVNNDKEMAFFRRRLLHQLHQTTILFKPEPGKRPPFKSPYTEDHPLRKALLKKLVLKNNLKPSFNQNVELTEREFEVLKLICEEKTAAEIAKDIFLSPRSVEGIRQRLIEKIGVRNTAGLVMFAVKNNMVD